MFFSLFYDSGSYEKQILIIGRSVKSVPVASRRGKDDNFKRNFSRQYFIPSDSSDIKVCKIMFLKTLQIDSAKIHRALQKISTGNSADQRGKHIPDNKFSEERTNFVKNHIKSFPVYRSHYCRVDNPNKKFLHHGLNLSMMYRLYKERMTENNLESEIVSQSVYEKIFYTDFNLSFKPPHKDTCKTCDSFKVKIMAIEKDHTEVEGNCLQELKTQQELHHRKVEMARTEMKNDIEKPKKQECTVLSFDLQKTYSLPKVPTGEVYYKRQLSVHNLGIHDLGTGKATCGMKVLLEGDQMK